MYLIIDDQPWAPSASALPYPYAFDRSELANRLTQHYLHTLDVRRHRVVCCCDQRSTPPLVLRRLQTHYCLARRPDSCEHAPTCHHASGDVGENRGFEPGALTRTGERLVLDLRLWLPTADDSGSSGAMGIWRGTPADHGPRLRMLLWLLLEGSGLNAYHMGVRPRAPLSALFGEARRIDVRDGNRVDGDLTHMMLLGAQFDAGHAGANRAKLKEAVDRRRKLLVLSMLPPDPIIESESGGNRRLPLKRQLGVPVNVPERLLEKALMRPHLRSWRNRGRPVLLLGLATAATFQKDDQTRVYAVVKHLVLIPLHESGTPVPSERHQVQLANAIKDGRLYVATAPDDPFLQQAMHKTRTARARRATNAAVRMMKPVT